jgi:hypothetical protein
VCTSRRARASLALLIVKTVEKFAIEIHDPEEVHEHECGVNWILSRRGRQKPALIHTDIFEISLLYSTFNMERGKHFTESHPGQTLIEV